MTASLSLERATAPTDEVRALIIALDETLSQHYSPEQRHGLQLEAIFQPHISFFLARLGGVAVGCAGIARYPGFAEVKRMFVTPAARHQGIAQTLLARLETEARQAGLTLLKLETGVLQPEAIRLYEAAGFTPCAIFGDYLGLPAEAVVTSLFYEKQLGAA